MADELATEDHINIYLNGFYSGVLSALVTGQVPYEEAARLAMEMTRSAEADEEVMENVRGQIADVLMDAPGEGPKEHEVTNIFHRGGDDEEDRSG